MRCQTRRNAQHGACSASASARSVAVEGAVADELALADGGRLIVIIVIIIIVVVVIIIIIIII